MFSRGIISPYVSLLPVVCLLVSSLWVTESGVEQSKFGLLQVNSTVPTPLKFIRSFSSADDVTKELYPVLDRSLDIIAGPADPHSSIDKLQAPYAVTTDSKHRVIVTDPKAGIVHIFDFEHSRYATMGGRGSRLRSPTGVAVDSDDNIYLSDPAADGILVYSPGGRFLHSLGKMGDESYFQGPVGIAVHTPTGHIYVCDSRRHMVLQLDRKGHILGHFGKRWGGKGPGDFRYPSQLAIAGDELFVLDRGNSRLQILDLNGHFRREISLPEVSFDAGLALDHSKNIYISDGQFNVVNVFTFEGQPLFKYGHAGAKPGEFDAPSGLWIDSANKLYVTDTKNRRIQLFQIGTQP